MANSRRAALLELTAVLSLPAVGGELGPGRHRSLKCADAPQYTYDVYLPRAYGSDGDRHFPVLFLSSPGANPGFMGTESWAEKNGVIVVAINDTKNGQTVAIWDEIQSAVLGSVEATLRLHPHLRFSMGFSGGGMASMHLANRYGEKHAGIVMLGHSGNGEDRGLPKYISVAFVHAENDKTHPVGAVLRVFKKLKSRGHPVRKIVGDWGHDAGPVEHRLEMLGWVLEVARLSHPRLSQAERAEAHKQIKRRVDALAVEKDAGQRLKEAETLLELPGSDKWPSTRDLLAAWFSARFELAAAAGDLVEAHEALTELAEEEHVRRCAPADRRRLASELAKLRRKSPVKKEWKAKRMYDQIAAFEKKAGKSRSKLIQAVQSYNALARAYPRSKAGKKAAEDVKRIAKDLGIPVR